MFSLAMEAKARGRGVVGSTSDILGFIAKHVTSALGQPFLEPIQVQSLPPHRSSISLVALPLHIMPVAR